MRPALFGAFTVLLAPAALRAQEPWAPVVRAGDLRIDAKGYVQLDVRGFPNWPDGETIDDLRSDAIDFRRVRLGAEGDFRRLSFELDFDPADPDREYLKDAYADVEIAKELRIRGGNFKLPFSPELLRSPAKIDFIERAIPVDALSPRRDLGVMLHGKLFERVLYQAGFFAGDGRTRSERAGPTAAARLAVEALDGLQLGVSFTRGSVEESPEPQGFAGQNPVRYEFFAPRFIEGERTRLDFELKLVKGPVAIRAELLKASEERLGQGALFDDLPALEAIGWYVSGTWLVTGEKKRATIRPDRPLPAGMGAVEIGLRLESLRFDDAGTESSFESASDRARNVRPAGDLVLTGGISWWPSRFVRVMTNVIVDRYEDPLLAPELGRTGSYVTLLARLQFQLPQ